LRVHRRGKKVRKIYNKESKLVIYKSKKNNKKPYVSSPRSQYAAFILFDRHDKVGREICRNIECDNFVTPSLHYCSYACKKKFYRYHKLNFTWHGVRWRVFVRDKWTCKLCGIHVDRPEADHIKPVALIKDFGYKTMTLKAYKEYVFNLDNLRTLCYKCHKAVTKDFVENIEVYRQKIKEKKSKILFVQ
jgi:5-methylcytosine-specific restriction endonuclease McrA